MLFVHVGIQPCVGLLFCWRATGHRAKQGTNIDWLAIMLVQLAQSISEQFP